ncbi:putative periplasmic serine endoprotease DegP-like precursor [Marinobacterium sp. xm-a-121]|uniref:DegQ family serine endoprotease n=1 Tax=unclassified Marinobacterium TaxID=2644139 RepID=UPI0015694D16|nr:MULTISPECIES: DegQ family serine endoprotease [unclassified Marinobacterium]NRP39116.1 putative periplasmic serine endoprotease DegP-like precursor [Marinobacterium sp. xm-a-121]NRQ00769.1 putative periplasmic serine endoprotease DegP-like precursor [Marinobacterium sp. xm-v-233]
MTFLRSITFVAGIAISSLAMAKQLPDFTDLVKTLSPSVVNISTIQEQKQSSRSAMPHNFNDQEVPEIFRDFFRGFQQPPGQQPRMHPQSLGSGFIISDDGYILTNHHVIDKAEKVLVRLNDRREIEAEIIGSDQRSDVALLKVDAKDLPALEIGSSSELEVGEWVLAIGSPFGFDSTVTAGIVSAKERALPGDSYVPFIQTDVAINPGNSGGPLFNLDGEVVGINSQIYTRSGGFMGVSFSIPIDVAMEVANQIKEKGSVSRGWLGVIIQEVTRDLAESFGLDKPSGALVAQVLSDSPAEEAGFEAGDVIVKFNGREIGLSAELPAQVGRIAPGETADVEVFRSGRSVNLKVTIGELPSNEELAANQAQPEPKERKSLGLVVQDMTSEIKERTGVDAGVYVESVGQGPAANAGVRQGDVITMLAGQSISSVEQLSDIVADLPGDKAVPLRVIRGGNPVFLAMRLE